MTGPKHSDSLAKISKVARKTEKALANVERNFGNLTPVQRNKEALRLTGLANRMGPGAANSSTASGLSRKQRKAVKKAHQEGAMQAKINRANLGDRGVALTDAYSKSYRKLLSVYLASLLDPWAQLGAKYPDPGAYPSSPFQVRYEVNLATTVSGSATATRACFFQRDGISRAYSTSAQTTAGTQDTLAYSTSTPVGWSLNSPYWIEQPNVNGIRDLYTAYRPVSMGTRVRYQGPATTAQGRIALGLWPPSQQLPITANSTNVTWDEFQTFEGVQVYDAYPGGDIVWVPVSHVGMEKYRMMNMVFNNSGYDFDAAWDLDPELYGIGWLMSDFANLKVQYGEPAMMYASLLNCIRTRNPLVSNLRHNGNRMIHSSGRNNIQTPLGPFTDETSFRKYCSEKFEKVYCMGRDPASAHAAQLLKQQLAITDAKYADVPCTIVTDSNTAPNSRVVDALDLGGIQPQAEPVWPRTKEDNKLLTTEYWDDTLTAAKLGEMMNLTLPSQSPMIVVMAEGLVASTTCFNLDVVWNFEAIANNRTLSLAQGSRTRNSSGGGMEAMSALNAMPSVTAHDAQTPHRDWIKTAISVGKGVAGTIADVIDIAGTLALI